jgi:hypothetical protein
VHGSSAANGGAVEYVAAVLIAGAVQLNALLRELAFVR